MSVLSDKQIRKRAFENDMISPFAEATKGISAGVSAYGYDARLGNKLYIFKNELSNKVIDPKNFADGFYEEHISEEEFIIPPHGFALGKTFEYFKIPRDIMVLCVGKSTYARCGLIVNVTPLEPGWEGYVTLEFSNTTNYNVKIYPNEGICQFIFNKADSECEVSYNEKKGKYMNQKDIVTARLK